MTRKLDISARQITAICRGAAKAGCVAELVINGTVVRLVPEGSAAKARSLDDELDDEWQQFQERLEREEAEWKALVPGPRLNWREEKALAQLDRHGTGVVVGFEQIRGMGIDTAERLAARGFVEIRSRSPESLDACALTDAGLVVARKLAGSGRR
jgi:hypothetical protein